MAVAAAPAIGRISKSPIECEIAETAISLAGRIPTPQRLFDRLFDLLRTCPTDGQSIRWPVHPLG